MASDWRPVARGGWLEAGGWRLVACGWWWWLEAGDWWPGAGGWMLEAGGRRLMVRGRWPEAGGQGGWSGWQVAVEWRQVAGGWWPEFGDWRHISVLPSSSVLNGWNVRLLWRWMLAFTNICSKHNNRFLASLEENCKVLSAGARQEIQ